MIPEPALDCDGESGHVGVADAAQKIAEFAMCVGSGVVGLNRHDEDRLAARCEEVAERVQSAFGSLASGVKQVAFDGQPRNLAIVAAGVLPSACHRPRASMRLVSSS